ncbi:hypothetical protein K4F52_001365 [Lecanicillium sp. MT-2017a]|nr:hypothetical protein K4F52_001365 [Lecanicillium sp. MT-2017a]
MLCHLHKHDEEDVVRDWMQKGTGSFKGCDEDLRGALHEEVERLKMRRVYDEAMQISSLPHQPRTHESHQRADQQTREEQQYLRMSIRVADSISRPQSQQKPYHSTKQQVPERLSFDASDSNPLSHQQQNPHHGTAQQGQESPSFNVEDPDSPSQRPQIHPHLDTKQLEQESPPPNAADHNSQTQQQQVPHQDTKQQEQESPPLNAEDHNSQTQQQQVPHQDTKQQKQDKCEPEPAQAQKMQIKGQEWPDASSRCICKCNSLDADPDNKHLKLRWPTIFVLCALWDRCWGAVEKRPGLWGRIVFALVFILFTDAMDGGKTNFQRASKTT